MASRALRPRRLLDVTVPRASQRIWRKPSVRGIHSEGVDSVFASQLDAIGVLCTSSGQKRGLENTSLYSLKPSEEKQLRAAHIPTEKDREAMSFLEKKVEDLKLIVSDTNDTDLTCNRYEPAYTDTELLDLYQDLLSAQIQTPEAVERPTSEIGGKDHDRQLLLSLIDRLGELSPPGSGTSQSHASRVDFPEPITHVRRVVSQLVTMLEGMDIAVENSVSSSQRSLLSSLEWAALIRECIRAKDEESAVMSLTLMKKAGLELDDNVVTPLIAFYARAGGVARTESTLSQFVTGAPNLMQRHHHIKAYINSTSPGTIPLSALSLLHKYENAKLAPPMKTYTLLISTLTSVPSSLAKAQAWDLFSHMRYVAHPTPDAVMYGLMILACARTPPSGGTGDSEPQRALDLFTEMTEDNNISPTREVYTAVILACARSGQTKFVNEAFRLAKEMLDGHRDALGRPAFTPNNALFGALLQGAKRTRDLPRARWILAEMVRVMVRQHHVRVRDGMEVPDRDEIVLTENHMVHVFHAYASYQVPFNRSATRIAETRGGTTDTAQPESTSSRGPADTPEAKVDQGEDVGDVVAGDTDPRFSSIPPQSRGEVLAEAKNLFEGILHDTRRLQGPSNKSLMLFKNVRVSTELVNAYLAVHYSHGGIFVSRDLFKTLFEEVGVKRNFVSYVDGLEACAKLMWIKSRRNRILEFAEEVWELAQKDMSTKDEIFSAQARLLERANVALIRVFSSLNLLDKAMKILRSFAQSYPPKVLLVLQTSTKPPLRSTDTVLYNSEKNPPIPTQSAASILSNIGRPLVRLTSDTELVDDRVPPFLTFKDVELLHHRLIAANRSADLRYLTWLLQAYSGSLRKRRERTLEQGVARSLSN